MGGPNFGQLVVRLKPRNDRKESVNEIIDDLRPKLAEVPGMKVYLQNPPTIRIGGQVTKSLYQFSMQSPNKPELYAAAQKMEEEIAQIPGRGGRHQRSGHHQPAGERRPSIATRRRRCR